MRRTMPPVSGARTRVFFAMASASGCEKLASNIRAAGFSRASRTARWIATMVFPVPADPAPRAGPAKGRSTRAPPRRSRHAGRPREGALDQRALRRMQEDAPLLPRKGKRLFQFLLIGDRAN